MLDVEESMSKEEEKPQEKKPTPDLVAEHTEFETKYRVDASALTEFKRIMDGLPNLKKFIYVEGPDHYYTNEHITKAFRNFADTLSASHRDKLNALIDSTIGLFPPFMRFRRPSHGLDENRQELTTKYRQDGAKNNIQREEKNLRVDKTSAKTIGAFVEDIGYKANFSVWKTCHIYNLDDATLVYYSVYDTTDGQQSPKVDNFFEIEVDEETVSTLTQDQAWAVIVKYEKMFESLGINPQKRLRKSMFDMYRRELK